MNQQIRIFCHAFFIDLKVESVMDIGSDDRLNDTLVSYSNKALDLRKECVSLSMNITSSSHQ